MLPVFKTRTLEFSTPSDALAHLDRQVQQRFTVPLRDLRVTESGRLRHVGALPIDALHDVALTDTALDQLDSVVGIPRGYARQIEPALHEHSLNDLVQQHVASVTVVVTCERDEPDLRRASGVVVGARTPIEHVEVLRCLDARELPCSILLKPGELEVLIGMDRKFHPLPGDAYEIAGTLRNEHWSPVRARARSLLEVGVFLLRLVCSNGAYAARSIADGRLYCWTSRKNLHELIHREIDHALSFSEQSLARAVERMSETMPEEPERAHVSRTLERAVGQQRARELLASAVSWYDHFNAVTAAAHVPAEDDRRRSLQVAGGAVLDKFLNAA